MVPFFLYFQMDPQKLTVLIVIIVLSFVLLVLMVLKEGCRGISVYFTGKNIPNKALNSDG